MKRVRLHLLTDGRDVPDGSSVKFFTEVQDFLKGLAEKGVDAAIASGGGRMQVTMDRYEVLFSRAASSATHCSLHHCRVIRMNCWGSTSEK